MVKIGLTGGIATGKTTISKYLSSLGIPVIDADLIAREVLTIYPEILEYLRKTYGDRVFSGGKLDRRALGRILFQDKEALSSYLQVIMPRIRQEIEKRLEKSEEECIVLDAPLLFEEGFQKDVDLTITVYAQERVQLQRLKERDGFTEEEARRRISAQMDLKEKMDRSTYVLNNSGALEDTIRDLHAILDKIGIKYGKKEREKKKRDPWT
ncbi:dephospho-CoA kinase [Proteiniclasticum sp. SCR006]|uniref:Dephospho-CoA kinase n=1 Tax=Proteiniclasticum aestuarii TaxID=2817862 RepID=A0A939H4Q3_9CLOT|nr:dephospho-CoA kinase [Proteiniclasticum aestuarii]MBO1264129.1 dephospho-CoA kinase [Proteiniclasticum aestuarii]